MDLFLSLFSGAGVDLRETMHRLPPEGCQSSTGPHRKEVVVHNSAAALPLFIVKLRLQGNRVGFDPYAIDTASRRPAAQSDGAAGREFLVPLEEVPPLLSNLNEGTVR